MSRTKSWRYENDEVTGLLFEGRSKYAARLLHRICTSGLAYLELCPEQPHKLDPDIRGPRQGSSNRSGHLRDVALH